MGIIFLLVKTGGVNSSLSSLKKVNGEIKFNGITLYWYGGSRYPQSIKGFVDGGIFGLADIPTFPFRELSLISDKGW
ncbi:hypothetical protein COLO4_01846 [Corchorus olitorius]|uniref:Uncharacterized protein n=1 Tax=Corchorus olitorius TaxID=93759 RepID=A0A1R3L250_9ROSI|nr:hypothetical protein COLO4_01846 [Corchorus olitorius]